MKKIYLLGMSLFTSLFMCAENIIQVLPCDLSKQDYIDVVMTNEFAVSSCEASVVLPDGMTVTSVDYPVAFPTKDYNADLEDYDLMGGKYVYLMGMSPDNIINPGSNTPVFRMHVSCDPAKIQNNTVYPVYVYSWYMCDESFDNEEDQYEMVCTSCVATGETASNEIKVKGVVASMLGNVPDGSFQVALDMTEATGGILNLSDKVGLANVPSGPMDKVTYTRTTLAAKYGTICVPFDLASDSKIQYYTISEAAAGQITISKVASVPAGTPAIYENNGASEISFSGNDVTLAAAGTDGAGAELVGTYTKTKVTDANTYYLKDGKFNRINGSFNSGAFKAYAKSGSALAKALEIFVDDADPTAINGASTSASIEGIYNAAGAQNKKLEKGVNILKMSDGSVKKVLVK